jgi:2-haloacid dehalogenase
LYFQQRERHKLNHWLGIRRSGAGLNSPADGGVLESSDEGVRAVVRHYDAVLFDLLTALGDSWTLWNRVAGNAADGKRWRTAYLGNTYAAGRYRAYEVLVAEAAEEVGLPRRLADDLAADYAALEPWPEAPGVLNALSGVLPFGIVTNCSEELGRIAAARTGAEFAVIVTAERAGFYKPHPKPYQIALEALGVSPERCLFVAGSPYDLFGAGRLGLPAYWRDRVDMSVPSGTPAPLWHEKTLTPLLDVLGLAAPRI